MVKVIYTLHFASLKKDKCLNIAADDPNAEITKHFVDNPLQRSTKIKDLDPETEYILYIWARTNAGAGDQDFLEDKTMVIGRK